MQSLGSVEIGLRDCGIWGNKLYVVIFGIYEQNIAPCTQHSMLFVLADSHSGSYSGHNIDFLAPANHRPPFATAG